MELVSILAMVAAAATLAFAWIRRMPIVMAIVIANFVVFILELTSGSGLGIDGSPLLRDLATRVSYLNVESWPRWYTIFSATFLHADFYHIIGNMLVLFMLGLPFEERVGRVRFVAVYFFSAVVAVLLHAIWMLGTGDPVAINAPLVGASGAVFGILGAFATMYPRDEVPVFLLFILLPRVPVYLAAILLTGIEVFALTFSASTTGVARAAHIGGAVGGVILGLLLRPKAGPASAARRPKELDYGALERLATQPAQRAMVEKVRSNADHAETQRAWLERLAETLACPSCGQHFVGARNGVFVCINGHRERYAG